MIKKLFSKRWAKIVLLPLLFVAYWNMGILFEYCFFYSLYHPKSIVSKVVFPTPSSILDKKLAVDKDLSEKYGSFENYYSEQKSGFLMPLAWPFIVFCSWLVSLIFWAGFCLVKFAVGFWCFCSWFFPWFFSGGILRVFGLPMPI